MAALRQQAQQEKDSLIQHLRLEVRLLRQSVQSGQIARQGQAQGQMSQQGDRTRLSAVGSDVISLRHRKAHSQITFG